MDELYALMPLDPGAEETKNALRAAADKVAPLGLALTEEDVALLVQTQTEALAATGRVSFGPGVLPRLVSEFADSPNINPRNFAATLAELQAVFYYFKNETLEAASDEELIALMKHHFDGDCQGDTELLSGKVLEDISRGVRFGQELHEAAQPEPAEAPEVFDGRELHD